MKNLSKNGVVTLMQFQSLDEIDRAPEPGDVPAIVLDVETTGLNPERDEVIQISIRPFFVSPRTGEVSGVKKSIEYFQQPTKPLNSTIKEITGLSDEDLEGKSIPWDKISKLISSSQFVICHNAAFDRQFVESAIRKSGLLTPQDVIWCCSMSQVNWDSVCRPSRSLEVLCAWHGFFYESHNATADVDALLHLLRKNDYMKALLENALLPDWGVFAVGSLREENPLLKTRRYRWNPDLSYWWKQLNSKHDADKESEWLKENLQKCEPQIFEIDPKHRFTT